MKKIIIFIAIVLTCWNEAQAQKKADKKEEEFRPAVLVVGNGNAAVAAAIQSAESGVQTAILLQAGGFDLVSHGNDLASGLHAAFQKKYDSTEGRNTFDKLKANLVVSAMTDTVKKLRVLKNITWLKAGRSGNNWNFRLSDGTTIKPKVLIMGTDPRLMEMLKLAAPAIKWNKLNYSQNIYRTSVAAGKSIDGATANFFTLKQLLVPDQENLVWLGDPESMELGQAAGATAAYAAFFDTKTSASNLKKIQGELIHFKLNQIPFQDITPADSNWKAIQFVGLTGVIKGDLTKNNLLFSPDKIVTIADIKQPLKDFYYKAQLWFDDFKGDKLTVADALNMIAYVGNKSLDQIKKELDKNWKNNYHFKSSFELSRQITRRELAVILQDYMPPFNVNIDDAGKVIR